MSNIKRKRFYKSRAWRTLADNVKMEREDDQGFLKCEHCGRNILKRHQAIAHHTIELTEDNVDDANVSMDKNLIEIICHQCHNVLHDRFNNNVNKEVVIVHGPPFSGKLSYVLQNKGDNDIVVEIDKLYQAITMNNLHEKNFGVSDIVFAVRDVLYDNIKHRRGRWSTAYVVGTFPTKSSRQRIQREVGSTDVVHITASKDNCIANIAAGQYDNEVELISYVEKYFKDFN